MFASRYLNKHLPLHLDPPLSIQQPWQRAARFPFIETQYNPSHDTVRNFLHGCLQTIREKKERPSPLSFFLPFSPHKRNSKAFPNLVDCPSRKRNYSSYQAARTTPAVKWLIKPHCCYHWNHSETMLSCRGSDANTFLCVPLVAQNCRLMSSHLSAAICESASRQKHNNLPHFVALKLYIDYLPKCTRSPNCCWKTTVAATSVAAAVLWYLWNHIRVCGLRIIILNN